MHATAQQHDHVLAPKEDTLGARLSKLHKRLSDVEVTTNSRGANQEIRSLSFFLLLLFEQDVHCWQCTLLALPCWPYKHWLLTAMCFCHMQSAGLKNARPFLPSIDLGLLSQIRVNNSTALFCAYGECNLNIAAIRTQSLFLYATGRFLRMTPSIGTASWLPPA